MVSLYLSRVYLLFKCYILIFFLFLSYIGTKSDDYHNEMNWEHFQMWLKYQLIPNLPPNSVLVVDSAAYHNIREIKEPSSTTPKVEMLLCLEKK
jgi:hypothetical protein